MRYRHSNGLDSLNANALIRCGFVLLIGQPAHGFEEQLWCSRLCVEAQTRNELANADILRSVEASVLLQRTVLTITLAEDRLRWQRQLQHVTINIVSQHHSDTLIEAASAAITLTGTLHVLGAACAGWRLCGLACGIRGVTVGAPAGWCSVLPFHESITVERTGHLGCSSYDHNVKEAVINGSDFFTAAEQAEHAALDGDTFACSTTTSEGSRYGIQNRALGVGWHVGGRIEYLNLRHNFLSYLVGRRTEITTSEITLRPGTTTSGLALMNSAMFF